MSFIMKIVAIFAGVLLIIGSICVTIAALFPPKEWKGRELPPHDKEPKEE